MLKWSQPRHRGVITVRRMAVGSGFRYLMSSVAAGDGAKTAGTPLTRYYAESGTPPGIFVGRGLPHLGLEAGDTVTEEHLWRMLGVMADPVTGQPLGSVPRVGKSHAVAGLDLTFSPPKSFSTMWALADDATRDVLYRCHRQAIDVVLSYAEKEVLHSRSGRNGVVQEDIEGAVAVSFTHWDNRSGDPQLHDHVVIWNRARSVSDGHWRTLDSRGLYKSVVALSEMHQGVLADLVAAELGVGWDGRKRRHNDRPRWEITGVPEALLQEFSQRNEQVEVAKDVMVAQFETAMRRRPMAVEVMDMRRKATVLTRPEKQHRRLVDLTADWHRRATAYVGDDHTAWVTLLRDRCDVPRLQADDLGDEILADAARAITETVAERRAVYTKANLLAEAHRLIQGVRFATPDERITTAGRIVKLAVEGSLELSAPEICRVPSPLRRRDGTSRLRPKGHELYTTTALWEAEERLLEAARRVDGPGVAPGTVAMGIDQPGDGRPRLSLDQAVAVEKIATSGRSLDLLVGPAGAGKSTTMAGLRSVWEAQHGPGSVIGLAPSAGAAEVLADELGVGCDNTAKWLTEHGRQPQRFERREELCRQLQSTSKSDQVRRQIAQLDREIDCWQFHPGQLVIVDEATLAGTFALDLIVSMATEAGAKVLLLGDPAQMSSVEAGGAFAMLTRDRGPQTPALTDVHRFQNRWTADASLALRDGHQHAIDTYLDHRRVVDGDREQMLDTLHQAWEQDVAQGRSSVMIAIDTPTVDALNRRARAVRVATGEVQADGVEISSGKRAGVGDHVVTRQNDRRMTAGRGWVKNGDRWLAAAIHPDGSLTAKALTGTTAVILPAEYVVEHVELAYATTAHRPRVGPLTPRTYSSTRRPPANRSTSPPPAAATPIISTSIPPTTATRRPDTRAPTSARTYEKCSSASFATRRPQSPPTTHSAKPNTPPKA